MNPPAWAIGMAVLGLAAPAMALPTIYNADIPSGVAAFDAAVLSTGQSVSTKRLRFLQDNTTDWAFSDFSISSSDGTHRVVEDDYAALAAKGATGALSGWAISITPHTPAADSGLRFDFAQPVNAFGLEIGDWGTCCHPSSLFIAFDGGATRLVATARSSSDNPGFRSYGQYTNFVGAVDTSGTFSTITLYGDGMGEFLLAGGTIRWASLPLGSATPLPEAGATSVPELNTGLLMGAGLLGVLHLGLRRRRGLTLR